MAVPQNIPNAVRKVRVLLRDSVAVISRQLSISKIGFFIDYNDCFEKAIQCAMLPPDVSSTFALQGKKPAKAPATTSNAVT